MESIAQQNAMSIRPTLSPTANSLAESRSLFMHLSCVMNIAFKNLKSTNQTKVINSITIHVHARPCYNPWLDPLIVNLLVWNNSGLQPSNRPIKNNAISCFTFMIDTRIIGPILFLNIFGLFITPRLSNFNSGGNSGLNLVGHFEMGIRSIQIPKSRGATRVARRYQARPWTH